ncbi:MAG: VIT1/CCC1 transporter family protein [Burkholderiales bacterium]|nr:VIT1/CCC1 transporter family protein [Burkholderiales bacterium]
MTHHELASWYEEKQSSYLYRLVSDAESGTPRQMLFLELARAADKQAELWVAEMKKTGIALPGPYTPDRRTRVVGRLVQWLGPRRMRPVLAAMKVRGMSLYTKAAVGHAIPTKLSEVGRRHQNVGASGTLRAAVFGVNDGLVSNASLILGVAGATSESSMILLSGVAGLLAGAFSMAAGEYISMRSQREMFEYQIGMERAELEQYPQEEAAELALIFAAKGMGKEEARQLADKLIADPDHALDTLAREELGLNPDELGSPWGAAFSSLGAFAAGAMIPLLPYLFMAGNNALLACIGMTAAALFAVGAALSLFTGRNAWLGALRMLAIGSAAGAGTFIIGKALGVTLG